MLLGTVFFNFKAVLYNTALAVKLLKILFKYFTVFSAIIRFVSLICLFNFSLLSSAVRIVCRFSFSLLSNAVHIICRFNLGKFQADRKGNCKYYERNDHKHCPRYYNRRPPHMICEQWIDIACGTYTKAGRCVADAGGGSVFSVFCKLRIEI